MGMSPLDSVLALVPATAVTRGAPLAPWCTVRVGGSADALIRPPNPDVLVAILSQAKKARIPITLLGGGANTVVGDLGVRGVTLKLPADIAPEVIDGPLITLSAGSAIARIVTVMKQQKLVGAEFVAGIPGTLGGAVAMNAGTKNGETMTVVDALELATADGVGWVPASSLEYEYRHTHLPPGAIVVRVRFKLREGDLAESQRKMDEDLGYRKRTQPLSQPNFGSVFTNPPGRFAGALIESVKLKGHTIGGAQISEKHANWIVNLGGAKAADVVALMTLAQTRVREATGVELHPEVKRIGEF
jgi:UDP-N-acetylmuramate dehydrogenase